MAIDALGREVHIGDLIAYGSGQNHAKAGFRLGLVIKTERPTVIPFEKTYWEKKWRKMRTFTFQENKAGDFAIVDWTKIKDQELRKLVIAEVPMELF